MSARMPNIDDNSAGAPPSTPSSVADMSDGELADEFRGQTFAYDRAKARLDAIKAEMKRRGETAFRGKTGLVTLEPSDGLLDFKRIRAEHGAGFISAYRLPGSETFFKVRTLSAAERAAQRAG